MVRQTSVSARDFRTNSLDRLNNTYRPSAELEQDRLRITSQSYNNNRFLLYFLIIIHSIHIIKIFGAYKAK
jgi:hypothetical protein